MARTIQPISHTLVETTKMQYTASSSNSAHSEEPEDNLSILFSLCDSMNNLCITLEKLDHVLKMKTIELRIKLKGKEKASPQAEPSD